MILLFSTRFESELLLQRVSCKLAAFTFSDIVDDASANPRVGVVMLIPIPEGFTLRKTRWCCIRASELYVAAELTSTGLVANTHHHLMVLIKEVTGVPRTKGEAPSYGHKTNPFLTLDRVR
jgi:hypothetical protein